MAVEKKEEEKSMGFRMEDFDDVKLDPDCTKMDCLAAVAGRARELLQRSAKGKGVEMNNDHEKTVINKRFCPASLQDYEEKYEKKEEVEEKRFEIKNGRDRIVRKLRILGPSRFRPASVADSDNDQEYEEKEEEEEGNKKRKRKYTAGANSPPPPPPPPRLSDPILPDQYMRAIERYANGKMIDQFKFVLSKHIYKTDISSSHNRLSLPKNMQRNSFLTEEEENYLKLVDHNNNGRKVIKPMEVDVIDPSFHICRLELKIWAKGMYVLAKGWNKLVQRNSIRVKQTLNVWTVRVDQRLLFILARVPEAAADQ